MHANAVRRAGAILYALRASVPYSWVSEWGCLRNLTAPLVVAVSGMANVRMNICIGEQRADEYLYW